MTDDSATPRPLRVLHVTTVPMSLAFLRGQTAFMRARGIELTFVSSPGPELELFAEGESARVFGVPMSRRITPAEDALALTRLTMLVQRLQPDIVHGHTPKGSLLAMCAARATGVASRFYHMRGLPLEEADGPRRWVLRTAEWTSCRLATHVFCVSQSLRAAAVSYGVVDASKARVLGQGSGQGVDARGRFDPARLSYADVRAFRSRLGIGADATVIAYVGRLVRDKGIRELWSAWRTLREHRPNAFLLIAGRAEAEDPIDPGVAEGLHRDDRVRMLGHVADPAIVYASADVVVLPTYREGFPNAALEAAAMCRPMVATRVTGCVDAVSDGETGTLVEPRSAAALHRGIARYLDEPEVAARHGAAGRARVLEHFLPERIWNALADAYFAASQASQRAIPHRAPRGASR